MALVSNCQGERRRSKLESVLRDLEREKSKMQADVDNLHRHYEKLAGFVREYIESTTIEWAKLVASHPKALLLLVETTRILDESGYASSGESEPIRFSTLQLASSEVWDQLLFPTYSRQVQGTEYHGLTLAELEGKPTISEAWPIITEALEGRQVIIFGADWARRSISTVYPTHALDGAYCLHNKAKEFYGEFYELSLQKILTYQGIDRQREQLRDSRDRLLMLAQVINNLAVGMAKQPQEPEASNGIDDLDSHPF
jgi:DNA polymerase III epsilon subunit-like protein